MQSRLFGIVATLWFFFALASLIIALTFSPTGLLLLLPGSHPSSWIYPALLVLPPLALLSPRFLSAKHSRVVLCVISFALGIPVLCLFALFGTVFFSS